MRSDHNFRSSSSITNPAKSVGIKSIVGIAGANSIFINGDDAMGLVGECQIDRRPYEAYCTQCNMLVCPSCAMFGTHKGHNFCTMEQASKLIRVKMDDAAKNGSLKMEKTENVLIDVRHTKLNCEEAKQRVIKEVETTFQSIFKLIKQRKEEVVSEVIKHFEIQLITINEQEKAWLDKQDRALELIKMAKAPNDYTLLDRAPYIYQSLELLMKQPQYHNLQIVNQIDTNFNAISGISPQVQIQLNLAEFKKVLEKWVILAEPVLIQFKC